MGKILDTKLLLQMREEGRTLKEIASHFNVSFQAISQRLKLLQGYSMPASLDMLTEKERKFAVAVAGGKSQTQAAFDAYDVTDRVSAKAIGHKLMKDEGVKAAVTDLMEMEGLTKKSRVKRLKEIVYHKDPHASLKALDQSWKLDGSYAPLKVVTMNFEYADMVKRKREILAEMEELESEYGADALEAAIAEENSSQNSDSLTEVID